MANTQRIILFFMILIFLGTPTSATEFGDPAFPLQVKTWVKGEPVNMAESKGDKIFVIEFWATWCGPCKATMPHLSKLQSKYKDSGVVIIGISGEGQETVQTFLKKNGNKMDYRVALDDGDNTAKRYMNAFGVEGIPHAFVINKNNEIVWQGHPLAGLDEALDEMVRGQYDLEGKRRAAAARKLIPVYLYLSRATNEPDLAKQVWQRIFDYGKKECDLLNELVFESVMDAEKGITKQDLTLALYAIEWAYLLCKGQRYDVVDTYARVLFVSGRIKEAIKYQEKAVGLSNEVEDKTILKATLDEYRKELSKI